MTMSQRNAIIENINYHLDSRVIAASIRPAYRVVEDRRGRSHIRMSEDFVEHLLDDGQCFLDPQHDDDARKHLHRVMLGPLGGRIVRAKCVRPGQYDLADDGDVEVITWASDEALDTGDFNRAWASSVELLCARTLEVAAHYEVCPTCIGRGKVVNPSIDAGGLTSEDFADDPDFADDYMGGVYDVTCPECRGIRVVPEVEFRGDLTILGCLIAEWERDQAQIARENAHQRAYGY